MLIGKDKIKYLPTISSWEMHLVHGWPFPFRRWQTYTHLRTSRLFARLPIGGGIVHYQSNLAFLGDLSFATVTVAGFASYTIRNRYRLPRRFSLRAVFVLTTMIAILGTWAVTFLQRRYTSEQLFYEHDIWSYLFVNANSPLDYWIGTAYAIGLPFAMLGVLDLLAILPVFNRYAPK